MPRKTVTTLCGLLIVLNGITALLSLTADQPSGATRYTSARGGAVHLHGAPPYTFDTVFAAAGFHAQDTITLAVALPLLALFTWGYWRTDARARALLSGVLAYILYVSASMALGAAYNPLFLLYVASLSASLFAFVLVVSAPLQFAPLPDRRQPALFMFVSGAVTLLVWTLPLLQSVVQRRPPPLLDHYTTMVTYALDLAIVTPAAFLAGALILKGRELGYRLAVPLLGLVVLLAPVIALSTFYQSRAGIVFTRAEIVGPVSGFLVLGLLGTRVLFLIIRKVKPGHDSSYAGHLVRPAGTRHPERRVS